MDTKELKKRLIRGFMRPPYFYLPVDISPAPTEKIVRFVISKITNPLSYKYENYSYEDETVDVNNDNSYTSHGRVYPDMGPAQATFETPQGRLWIRNDHDPAFFVVNVSRRFEDYERNDEIYVCKIYNDGQYIGHFFTCDIDIRDRDKHHVVGKVKDYAHESYVRTYTTTHARTTRIRTSATKTYYGYDSHAQLIYYGWPSTTGEPTNVDLSLFDIEGGVDNRYGSGPLDSNFVPCSVSEESARYDVRSPECGGIFSSSLISAEGYYNNSISFIRYNYSAVVDWWQKETANGIDLDKKDQGYYYKDDVQADIPRVEWQENRGNSISSFTMYNDRYDTAYVNMHPIYDDISVQYYYEDPEDYHSLKIIWTDAGGGTIPEDTGSVTTTYLGDGLNKTTCAAYQRAFGTNDYSSVGATRGVVEIEQ
jgi:hypothetical protein